MSVQTVLIADDHPATRAGVRLALERGGFVVCAEVPDGPSAIEAALRERPDVCLLDINMPGNGIEATKAIVRQLPETAVVMLTVSRSDADLFDALRAGASGYLLKDTDPARLPHALRAQGRYTRGNLLQLPPVLHRPPEAGGHGRPRR